MWLEIHMEVGIIVVILFLSIKKLCAPALFWAASTPAVIPRG